MNYPYPCNTTSINDTAYLSINKNRKSVLKFERCRNDHCSVLVNDPEGDLKLYAFLHVFENIIKHIYNSPATIESGKVCLYWKLEQICIPQTECSRFCKITKMIELARLNDVGGIVSPAELFLAL